MRHWIVAATVTCAAGHGAAEAVIAAVVPHLLVGVKELAIENGYDAAKLAGGQNTH